MSSSRSNVPYVRQLSHPSRFEKKILMTIDSLLLPLTLLLWLCFKVSVHGQSTEGDFISIDCGRPDCSYSKSYTRGITYICDDKFIDTGEGHRLPDNAGGEHSPMKYLRSFPNGTRNCFRIDVKENQKYIVRTYFMYGNYDGKRTRPGFHFYVGINFMRKYEGGEFTTVTYTVHEALVMSVSKSLSICLVNTNEGTPFISAIDLRAIPNILYPQVNASQLLFMANRVDYGAHRPIWYPDDKFDRVWFDDVWKSKGWNPVEETNFTLEIDNTTMLQYYELPQVVMQTAIVPMNGSSIEFYYVPWVNEIDVPLPICYITLYLAELEQLSSNESRIFTLSVNDIVVSDVIQPKYLQMTATRSIVRSSSTFELFRLSSVNGSTRPPILNAMEMYCALDLTRQPETEIGEVNAIMAIKELHKLRRNWMGDPCVPKAMKWEGLTCIYEDFITPRITSVNLSSSRLSGVISSSFGNLTQLQQLDLSNNVLTGKIPESLATLSQLKYLNLARNNLEGPIPKALLERFANHSLRLSIEGNPRLCTKQNSCVAENNVGAQNRTEVKNHKAIIIIISSVGSVVFVAVVLLIVAWKLRRREKDQVDIRSFTYNELASITQNFSNQIGRGGFGTVYGGIYNLNIQVAVKMLGSSSRQGFNEFKTELTVLKKVHHRNLVPFIGYCDDNTHLALVYEFMPGGSLADHLAGKFDVMDSFCWRDRIRIASEAAQGLEYLHRGCTPAIVHRDVKSSNILLTNNMEARIADFGLSKFQTDGVSFVTTRVVGTRGYLDPEYFTNNRLHEKSDVYSFGVVLMELITGKSATFDDSNGSHVLVQWVHEKLECGGIEEVIDKRLQDYNMKSICKAMEIGIACCVSESFGRPYISDVCGYLKECLELEINRDNYRRQTNEFNQHFGSSTSVKFASSSNSSILNAISR